MKLVNMSMSIFYNPFVMFLFIILAKWIIDEILYRKTSYYKATGFSWLSVRFNTGRYGEYLIYKHLKGFEKNEGKFLFNLYVPKQNGGTTEIDVVLICTQGVFVFESKNYSGWIFGRDDQRYWTQTLPRGRGRSSNKERFYNPVMQNKAHVKHLKNYIDREVPIHSIIAFSNRCVFKNVTIADPNVTIIKRYNISATVTNICNELPDSLRENDIKLLYERLYPLSQYDEEIALSHVANIRNKTSHNTRKKTSYKVTNPQMHIGETVSDMNQEENIVTPRTAAPQKCPKCGSMLVIRVAKKGAKAGNKFYGCSTYPKCSYIQNID